MSDAEFLLRSQEASFSRSLQESTLQEGQLCSHVSLRWPTAALGSVQLYHVQRDAPGLICLLLPVVAVAVVYVGSSS
jgi:hypothetical protein